MPHEAVELELPTTIAEGDGWKVERVLQHPSSRLTIRYQGDKDAIILGLLKELEAEERVSFKMALQAGVSGEVLRENQRFERLSEDEQWQEIAKLKTRE